MTLYCPNCNHEFAPDDRHCANCGMERPAAIQKLPTMILSQSQAPKSQSSLPDPLIPPADAPEKFPKLSTMAALSSTGPNNSAPVLEEPPVEDSEEEITDPSIPSFWKCSQCVSLNPSNVDYCENCGAPGPNTDPVALGEETAPVPKMAEASTIKVPTNVIAALAAEYAENRRGWRLNSSTGTNEGLTRKGSTNEDSQFSLELNRFFENRREAFGFYMVADGMGGQAAGEVASRMAIESISAIILNELAGPWMSGEAIKRVHVEKVLHEAILTAHARLREYNLREMRDAGTTLTACCMLEDWAVFANVGDSRTYLFRQPSLEVDTQPLKTMEETTDPANRATVKLNERERATDPLKTASNPVPQAESQAAPPKLIVERVTRDQSLVQNLVDQGELTIEDVYTDPRRNVILYALGAPDDNLPVDLYYRDLQLGDTVLLCSDGLWEMVRDKEIVDILVVLENLHECNRSLISLANQNGGADNISVILVRVEKD